MPGLDNRILRQIDDVFNAGTVVGLTDRQLVERFTARGDPNAEVAFAALVRRHGAMVLRVCRNILRDHHDAEDALQATFLILARKAGSLWVEDSLGPWLHGVACRVASTARAAAARRRAHESKVARLTTTLISEKAPDDSSAILHEELAKLPDRYRATVVLCDLEGRTYEEAAHELRRPVGTIKSRLARGREHLRSRMIRRGVVSPAVALAGAISVESSRSAVSAATVDTVSRLATRIIAGSTATDGIPSAALVLTEGVLKTMFLSKLKLAAAVVLVVCGMLSASVPHIGLIPSEAGQVANQGEPSSSDLAEPTTPTPVPASSPASPLPSPDDPGAPAAKPWETVVRIKILHDASIGLGSGTIIRSSPAESLILSSAHQFKLDRPVAPREISYRMKVDLFEGTGPAQIQYLETVDGEVVDCDFERDISLVRVRPGRLLPTSKVVPRRWVPRARMKMLTLGCSEGRDPTAGNTHITNPRFRGLLGNPGYQAIECQTAPKQGRTGGGLFTKDGYLAGVCNFAEPNADHGLYAGPDSIYLLLDRNHLTFLYDASVVTEKEIDDLLRAAEEQLEKDDREGAGRTIHQVDALIEARRKGLQDALRSLDANDSRRRNDLFRRASESGSDPQGNAIPKEDIREPGSELTPDSTLQPGADARLGRILDEWRRRSAACTSLDVRFTGRDRRPDWNEDEPLAGRIVLTSGGRAFVEVVRGVGKGSQRERIIWTDDAMHQFLVEQKTHIVRPIGAQNRGRLPAFLALPFFWNLNAENLKSRYSLELVKEEAETWSLRVTPLSKVGRETFSKALIELDRLTYLLKRYLLISPDGKSTKDFRVTEARRNQPVPEEICALPDDSGWKVDRIEDAAAHLFPKVNLDLLP